MGCAHCQALRDKLEKIRVRHGLDVLSRWGENVAVDGDLIKELHPMSYSTAGMASCRCDCHTPARIAGSLPPLPRLKVA